MSTFTLPPFQNVPDDPALSANTKQFLAWLQNAVLSLQGSATPPPPPVVSLNAVANGIQIVWTEVPGAATYRVYVGTTTDKPSSPTAIIQSNKAGTGTNSFTVAGLDDTDLRYVVVTAVNAQGYPGADSAQASLAPGQASMGNLDGTLDDISDGTKIRTLRIVAVGNSATSQPIAAGLYNRENTLLASASRSYNVDVIDRSTGVIESDTAYDVHNNSANAATMAAALNALGSDKIVIIRSFDEPQANRLTNNLPDAIYRCGGSRTIFASANFKYRSAYILIGIPGVGEGNGLELYSGDIDSDPDAWVDTSISIENGNVELGGVSARDAVDISYSDGTAVELLQPNEAGADNTSAHAHDINFIGTSAPGSPQIGWLWADTSTNPATVKRYNGSSWDTVGTLNLSADDVPESASRKWAAETGADITGGHAHDINFIGSSAPASPQTGWVWADTSTDPVTLKRYNGSSWDTTGTVNLSLDDVPDSTDYIKTPQYPGSAIQIENGGFLAGLAGWTVLGGTVIQDSASPYTNGYSAKMTGGWANYLSSTRLYKATSGQQFLFSCYTKSDGTFQPTVGLQFFDGAGTVLANDYAQPGTSTSWVQTSTSWTAPANTAYFRVLIGRKDNPGTTNSGWVTDIHIVRMAPTNDVEDHAINNNGEYANSGSISLLATTETDVGAVTISTNGGSVEVWAKVNAIGSGVNATIQFRLYKGDSSTGTQIDYGGVGLSNNIRNSSPVLMAIDPSPGASQLYTLTATASVAGQSCNWRAVIAANRKK